VCGALVAAADIAMLLLLLRCFRHGCHAAAAAAAAAFMLLLPCCYVIDADAIYTATPLRR